MPVVRFKPPILHSTVSIDKKCLDWNLVRQKVVSIIKKTFKSSLENTQAQGEKKDLRDPIELDDPTKDR